MAGVKTRGTVLRATVEVDYGGMLLGLMKRDPVFRIGTLAKIGKQARLELQRRWLSSPSSIDSLEYKGFDRTSRGRYKVVNKVVRRGVVFTSFPLNPFEFGRTYRGTGVDRSPFARKKHVTEPPRLILTVKFRNYLHANVTRFANKAMEEMIAKMEKEG